MLVLENDHLKVHRLPLGHLKANAYVVEAPDLCFIIDPAGDPDVLVDYLKKHKLTPAFCLGTHAHFDHIGAAAALGDFAQGMPYIVHEQDLPELKRANTMSLLLSKKPIPAPTKVETLNERHQKRLNAAGLQVALAPGHTQGSVILSTDDGRCLFSGDTILHHRLAGEKIPFFENKPQLTGTLKNILSTFKPETLVFPGHGTLSTLGVEATYNHKIRAMCGCEL